MRVPLRLLAEHLLDNSGLTSLALRSRKGSRLLLALHNIVPDEAPRLGDQALHLPLSVFRAVLDECAALGDIVPLSTALNEDLSENDRPRIAITFDDAYQGCLRYAMPELERRRLPVTIFVAPGILGGRTMWWDAIATPSGLDTQTRESALKDCAGNHDRIRHEWFAGEAAWAVLPDDWQTAHEEQVTSALRYDALTLAPHSWSHRNLTRCTSTEIAEELHKPVEWLAIAAAGRCLTNTLAYPYGLHDERVESAVASAGYTHALRVDGGWWQRKTPLAMQIPRLNIPAGISRRGFRLRLAGLMK